MNNPDLFGVVADEYREKQNQVTTMGKLVCKKVLIQCILSIF